LKFEFFKNTWSFRLEKFFGFLALTNWMLNVIPTDIDRKKWQDMNTEALSVLTLSKHEHFMIINSKLPQNHSPYKMNRPTIPSLAIPFTTKNG